MKSSLFALIAAVFMTGAYAIHSPGGGPGTAHFYAKGESKHGCPEPLTVDLKNGPMDLPPSVLDISIPIDLLKNGKIAANSMHKVKVCKKDVPELKVRVESHGGTVGETS